MNFFLTSSHPADAEVRTVPWQVLNGVDRQTPLQPAYTIIRCRYSELHIYSGSRSSDRQRTSNPANSVHCRPVEPPTVLRLSSLHNPCHAAVSGSYFRPRRERETELGGQRVRGPCAADPDQGVGRRQRHSSLAAREARRQHLSSAREAISSSNSAPKRRRLRFQRVHQSKNMSPLPEPQSAAIQAGSGVPVMSMLFLLTSQLLNSQQRRAKRDVSEEGDGRQGSTSQLLQVLNMFQNMDQFIGRDPDDMYEMLWAVDKESGCALKLTCTLAALPKHKARPEDMLLLRSVRSPCVMRNWRSPPAFTSTAAFMGAKSLNQQTCDALFKACPMPGDQMVSVWRSVVELVPSMLNTIKPGKLGK
ncbi:hypothetical protein FJT64_014647 [Amphibalanus amphitrite]|uniref:Uncharacterized protein n=1 Tax=Amphibalanus amphitrite TaxID=1232801 RepID=A0A6A4V5N8_AMPAM|nr:hypothetical protein FJT64_014647 [Amphibalanus amphitrite]